MVKPLYKRVKTYHLLCIVIGVCALFLITGCAKKGSSISASVSILSDQTTNGSPAVGVAKEQQNGYDAGWKQASQRFAVQPYDASALQNQKVSVEYINENAEQNDIQRKIRTMAQDKNAPLVAMLAATSNDATAHAAALANFFNVPMLVPSADGNNLFPSDNLWAFRLSAPSAYYAEKFFEQVVNKQAIDKISTPSDNTTLLGVPQLKIAIIYEQNTFGESAAVATAEAIMAQSLKIRVYRNYALVNTDQASLSALVEKVKDTDAQLVYMISSDPQLAKDLVQTFRDVFDAQSMPILVGQAEGFAALDFLDSDQAEGVYVLRQKIDRTDCPSQIESIYAAQTYAAVHLLDQTVVAADDKLASLPKQFSFKLQTGSDVQAQRDAIRESLKQFNDTLPCLGKVSFDNAGQNKSIEWELVHVAKGEVVITNNDDFLDALKNRLTYIVLN